LGQLNPHVNLLKFSGNRAVHNISTEDVSSAPVSTRTDGGTFAPIRDGIIDRSVLQDWQISISDFFRDFIVKNGSVHFLKSDINFSNDKSGRSLTNY
jgi:hypothetical protein